MPKGGQRNGYEQRQGATEDRVPCPYLMLGGSGTAGSTAQRYLSKGKRELFTGAAAYPASSRSAREGSELQWLHWTRP